MRSAKYRHMVKLLGGDYLASRAANALGRDGIDSMEMLDDLYTALGEDDLRVRLGDVRNFGETMMERAFLALAEYRKNPTAISVESEALEGALPEGFARRLRRTVVHYIDTEGDLFPSVQSRNGAPEGLTHEDLRALARLFEH